MPISPSRRTPPAAALARVAARLSAAALAATLVACGGGGGGGPAPEPTVTSVIAQPTNYTQSLTVTIVGSNVDQPLTVTTPACPTMTRSTEAPLASTSTRAYFQCSNVTLGSNQVTVRKASDGTLLGTDTFILGLPPQVTFTVSDGASVSGQFVVTLAADASLTPQTVNNFLFYVNGLQYNGTVFHRVYSDFVAQGGGYEPAALGSQRIVQRPPTRGPINLEINKGLSNKQWTIAMARDTQPNTAQTEFFINVVDNVALDTRAGGYAVFGHVSSGTDNIIAAIASRGCTIQGELVFGQSCLPSPNVVITSAVQTR